MNHKLVDSWADRQAAKETEKQSTEKHKDRETARQADRHVASRQTDM